jgi:hypothetical protein
MSQVTADETFEQFSKHWVAKEPTFRLNEPAVRDHVMTLISAAMSLLSVASEPVWRGFMDDCAAAAKVRVPKAIQERIKGSVGSQ